MKVRQFITIIFGCILIYKTWQSKYSNDFTDIFIWGGIFLFGFIFFIVTLIKDYKYYRQEKNWNSFTSSFTFLGFVMFAIAYGFKIRAEDNKPTLVKAVIAEDLAHVSIDLKTDGTYIFTNAFHVSESYIYGYYTISGDTILLDKSEIDNVIHSKKLVFAKKFKGVDKYDLYIMQANPSANDVYSSFKVLEDNR